MNMYNKILEDLKQTDEYKKLLVNIDNFSPFFMESIDSFIKYYVKTIKAKKTKNLDLYLDKNQILHIR